MARIEERYGLVGKWLETVNRDSSQQSQCSQGGLSSPSQQGPPGPPGRDGRDGRDGTNGQGQPGTPGVTGNPGPMGPRGIQGEAGEKGSIGAPGDKGSEGMQGPRGLPGLQVTGAKGAAGLPGSKGEVGPRGLPGQNGIKGDAGSSSDFAKIAFSAFRDAPSGNLASGNFIVFNKVVENIGGGYDKNTGAFICQQPGWYQFTLSVEATHNSFRLDIVLNDIRTQYVYGYAGANPHVLTYTWTELLEKDDKLQLKVSNGNLYTNGERRSYFTGFLIKANAE